MLILRTIAVIFISLSILTSFFKNIYIFYDEVSEKINNFGMFIFACLYSVLWRAFVIVAIWLV